MSMSRDSRFLWSEYLKNLFPIVFSVLGGTINTLIDSVMVSQRLGSEGLAAVNMSIPVYMGICIFGDMISSGASVMSAQSAGKERMEDAAGHYHMALTFSVLIGFLITVAGILSMHPLAALLSQGTSLEQYVYPYCLIMVIGALPTLLIYLPLSFLQLDGKMRDITIMMVIMVVTDTALDYILMFVFDYGIYGAAYASLISTLLSCIYGFVRLQSGQTNYRLKLGHFHFKHMLEICSYGSPAALGNLMDALKLLLINIIVLAVGGAKAVAVWAVLNSLSEFAISVIVGVPQAARPMLGAYYSARENSGIRILMKLQAEVGAILSVFFALMLLALSELIAILFAIDESLLLPLGCLGIFVILDLMCGICTSFFNATGKLMISNIIVFCRALLLPVACVLLLADSGVSLWLFLPLSGIGTLFAYLFVTGIEYYKNKKTERPLSRFLLLDDYLERENKVIDFSINADAENICKASEQITDFCSENEMDMKLTMKIQLAIEELLTVIVNKSPGLESFDLRAFSIDGDTGIRVRYAGVSYNPFEDGEETEDLMGINMISNMAKLTNFTYTLGTNTINILF